MLRFSNCCLDSHSASLTSDPGFVMQCETVLGPKICRDDVLLSETGRICDIECDQFTKYCGYPRGSSKCDALFRIISKREDTASCNLPGDVLCDAPANVY